LVGDGTAAGLTTKDLQARTDCPVFRFTRKENIFIALKTNALTSFYQAAKFVSSPRRAMVKVENREFGQIGAAASG
jgi:hypothetical protein